VPVPFFQSLITVFSFDKNTLYLLHCKKVVILQKKQKNILKYF